MEICGLKFTSNSFQSIKALDVIAPFGARIFQYRFKKSKNLKENCEEIKYLKFEFSASNIRSVLLPTPTTNQKMNFQLADIINV